MCSALSEIKYLATIELFVTVLAVQTLNRRSCEGQT